MIHSGLSEGGSNSFEIRKRSFDQWPLESRGFRREKRGEDQKENEKKKGESGMNLKNAGEKLHTLNIQGTVGEKSIFFPFSQAEKEKTQSVIR